MNKNQPENSVPKTPLESSEDGRGPAAPEAAPPAQPLVELDRTPDDPVDGGAETSPLLVPADALEEAFVDDEAPSRPDDGSVEDATLVQPPAEGLGDDATLVQAPAEIGDDATLVQAPAESGDDATLVHGAADPNNAFDAPSTADKVKDESSIGSKDPSSAFSQASPAATAGLTRMSDLEGRMVGRFKIGSRLGRGGMGSVFLARDESLGKDVAIKVMSPAFARDAEFVARFEREAKIMAGFDHNHIVRVLEHGEAYGLKYIAMDLVRGPNGTPTTVADLINDARKSKKMLPLERVVTIIQQACDALHEAHQKSVVHRDIKPGNMLIDARGSIRIADFGIASESAKPGSGSYTKAGPMGTYVYMPPEQRKDPSKVGATADVYALGAVLYELLTGQQAEGAVRPPSAVRRDVPKAVDAVVDKARQPKAGDRYKDMPALSAALRKAAQATLMHRIKVWAPIAAVLLIVAGTAFALTRPGLAEKWWDAVQAGDLARMQEILAEDPSLLNAVDPENKSRTALVHLAAESKLEPVRWLVGERADLNVQDADDWTALMHAASDNDERMVGLLIDAGANTAIVANGRKARDLCGDEVKLVFDLEPLIDAAKRQDRATIEAMLVDNPRLTTHQFETGGVTLLQLSAYRGYVVAVEVLLQRGAAGLVDYATTESIENVQFKRESVTLGAGATALIAATLGGHDDIVQLLLGAGADPDLADAQKGPLIYAIEAGDLDILRLLVEGGARLAPANPDEPTPLSLALQRSQASAEMVRLLVGDDNAVRLRTDDSGRTPLVLGLELGLSEEIIKILVGESDDVRRAVNGDGATPFLVAIDRGAAPSTLDLLIDADRTVLTTADASGRTPIQTAIDELKCEVMDYLIDRNVTLSPEQEAACSASSMACLKQVAVRLDEQRRLQKRAEVIDVIENGDLERLTQMLEADPTLKTSEINGGVLVQWTLRDAPASKRQAMIEHLLSVDAAIGETASFEDPLTSISTLQLAVATRDASVWNAITAHLTSAGHTALLDALALRDHKGEDVLFTAVREAPGLVDAVLATLAEHARDMLIARNDDLHTAFSVALDRQLAQNIGLAAARSIYEQSSETQQAALTGIQLADQTTPLHRAAAHENGEPVVAALLDLGVDPLILNSAQQIALEVAAGDSESFLLGRSLRQVSKSSAADRMLMLRRVTSNGTRQVGQDFFRNRGLDPKNGTILHVFAESRDTAAHIVEWAQRQNADLCMMLTETNKDGDTPAFTAARAGAATGDSSAVLYLLTQAFDRCDDPYKLRTRGGGTLWDDFPSLRNDLETWRETHRPPFDRAGFLEAIAGGTFVDAAAQFAMQLESNDKMTVDFRNQGQRTNKSCYFTLSDEQVLEIDIPGFGKVIGEVETDDVSRGFRWKTDRFGALNLTRNS